MARRRPQDEEIYDRYIGEEGDDPVPPRQRRNRKSSGGNPLILILGVVGGLVVLGAILMAVLLVPAVQRVRDAAAGIESHQHLTQIAQAMQNYHAVHKGLPPRAITDKDGKPLLSWRVAILPYLGENRLFQQFKLDEPWDSPRNMAAAARMPVVYQLNRRANHEPGMTYYQALSGPGTPLESDEPRPVLNLDQPNPIMPTSVSLVQITDGTSNTWMIVEADQPVMWTKPEDLPFDPDAPPPALGKHFRGGFNAAFMDGSVRFFEEGFLPDASIKALITHEGGEVVFLP